MKKQDRASKMSKKFGALFVMIAFLMTLVPTPALAASRATTMLAPQATKATSVDAFVNWLYWKKNGTFKWFNARASLRKCKGTRAAADITWLTDKQATKYQVRYSSYKNMRRARMCSFNKGCNHGRINGLTRNRVYYIQVRKVRTDHGKTFYSNWSAVARVVTR